MHQQKSIYTYHNSYSALNFVQSEWVGTADVAVTFIAMQEGQLVRLNKWSLRHNVVQPVLQLKIEYLYSTVHVHKDK